MKSRPTWFRIINDSDEDIDIELGDNIDSCAPIPAENVGKRADAAAVETGELND